MPFTPAQLVTGATYSLQTYERQEPIDQINIKHRLLEWLIKNKKDANYGNGALRTPIYYNNGSNTQNYFGADQVTYNERDPNQWTTWNYYNLHDGFWFDEDRLIAAGIYLTDDTQGIPTAQEKESLIDLLAQSYRAMKNSMQEHLSFEYYRDGTQSTKAAPGLEAIVDWTPAVGVVGGIDSAPNTWWRNNAILAVAAANLIDQMEVLWRNCMKYGGIMPNAIFCGSAFHDALRQQAGLTINRELTNGGNLKGGVTLDPGTNALFFHGVQVIWDPALDALDTLLTTTTRSKTCYFLNDTSLQLRPVRNNWMVNRRPERLPDRYVHYFGRTAKYGLVANQRNSLGIIQLA
jgi:hypothetical protein